MKNLLRDTLGRFKSVKIDLLDGQRRGEIIFRRAFFLIVMFTIVYLLGSLLVQKEPYERNIKEIQEVKATETILKDGDIVNGYEIDIDDSGKVWYIVPNKEVVKEEKSEQLKVIESFVLEGYKGSRIDREYLDLLEKYCDEETLKVVVGISVAESGMGKAVNRQSNFFGWFKGGDRSYDPEQDTMAQEICTGIKKSYMSIGKDGSVTSRYTGSDRSTTWSRNFNWAISQMEVE